jgi:hypothetical protein
MPFLAGNVVAYCIQLAVMIAVCAGLPRLLRVHAPAAASSSQLPAASCQLFKEDRLP